jgi:hypothetical protein
LNQPAPANPKTVSAPAITGRRNKETPTERAGVLALPEIKLGRYRTVSLTKLQWLGGHGLLVVAETAAKSDRRCDDDRAS